MKLARISGFLLVISLVIYGPLQGSLAEGSSLGTVKFTFAPAPAKVIQVSAGYRHSCALKSDGTVWTWGDNMFGQLGIGPGTQFSAIPVMIQISSAVKAISSGGFHTLALLDDGTVVSWGSNAQGAIGTGTPTPGIVFLPATVVNTADVVAVSAGLAYSLALTADGNILAWGNNTLGQSGNPNQFVPAQVAGVTRVVKISAGLVGSIAMKDDGTAMYWGQMYINGLSINLLPTLIPGLNSVKNISIPVGGGFPFFLALKSDGTVWATSWVGTSISVAQVPGLTGVKALQDSLATRSNGSSCEIVGVASPFLITPINLTKVIDISKKSYFYLALRSDGTVWAWGYNYHGELGNGTTSNSYNSTPTQVQF
ncbi:MAG: hypothetical protein HY606_11855 [Planctomycetes bacterium]|nr:hypothetical protein [Planctomycetota bacterium]